jgi:hypothetical protein
MYTGYAGGRIENIDDTDIPRIAAIIKQYHNSLNVSNEDFRWLMTLFVEVVAVTHMPIDIHCRTCRMKTLNCFIGFVDYWKSIGKI